jgi:hypothetical protein
MLPLQSNSLFDIRYQFDCGGEILVLWKDVIIKRLMCPRAGTQMFATICSLALDYIKLKTTLYRPILHFLWVNHVAYVVTMAHNITLHRTGWTPFLSGDNGDRSIHIKQGGRVFGLTTIAVIVYTWTWIPDKFLVSQEHIRYSHSVRNVICCNLFSAAPASQPTIYLPPGYQAVTGLCGYL